MSIEKRNAHLIIRLDQLTRLRTPTTNLLHPISIKRLKQQIITPVDRIGPMLPDQLCSHAERLARHGLVQVQCLFPVPVVCEGVGLAGC